MSQQFLESARRLLEQSQALPLELQQCQDDSRAVRTQAEQLEQQADLVRQRALEQVDRLAREVQGRCQQLSDGRTRLQTASDQHQEAQQKLSQTVDSLGLLLTQQVAEVVAGYDALDHRQSEATKALQQAAEFRRQVTQAGLEAVNAAWDRLQASFSSAQAATQSLLDSTRQALASEQRQMAELSGYLSQTLSQLEGDLETFGKEAEASEARFCERMHLTIVREVGANAAEIENTTAQSWHVGVDQSARESIAGYLERGVLFMGQMTTRTQQNYHPRLAALEKQLGKYDAGHPVKAQMIAMYNYLLALHQEELVTPWYSLMFGGSDG